MPVTDSAPRSTAARRPMSVEDRGRAWAVIGTGPHGLTALKALLQHGIAADGYEREPDLGGNWNFAGRNARVYRSTHLISSKPFTQFPDFPMPDAYPDYPSHWQVKEYFDRYAAHFGLRDRISFSTDVTALTPTADGRWTLTAKMGRKRISRSYAGVVVANGHNWSPKTPTYPGLDSFAGTVLHSAEYKGPEPLRGKRVLVVGAGNTGCDIAVESAQNATHTWHSSRRGYFYNPKYAFGRPADQVADQLLALRLPLPVRRALINLTLRLVVGDTTRLGLQQPDHKFFETHPIVNQQLVYYVGHGDIAPAPDVDRFDPSGVTFADGRRADVDVVVFATGYLVDLPFLAREHLPWDGDHLSLGLQMFPTGIDNLVVCGLIQPDSGQWALAHWQAMLAAAYAELRETEPVRSVAMHADLASRAGQRFTGGTTYKESTRHYYEVAHQEYLRALEDALHRCVVSA